MRRAIFSILVFGTLSFVFMPVFAGVSMCGYSEGDGVDLSNKANGLQAGGCCHVSGIDQDVGTGRWKMRVRCSACYNMNPFKRDTENTFYSCEDFYSNK